MKLPLLLLVAVPCAFAAACAQGSDQSSDGDDGGGVRLPDGGSSDRGSPNYDSGSSGDDASNAEGGDDGSSDGGGCSGSQQLCGNQCVDTTTDGHHCGWCGHDCQGQGCSEGLCAPIGLATCNAPGRVVVDSTSAYFTCGGSLFSVPIAGGSTTTLASGMAGGDGYYAPPMSLALDAQNVYVASQDGFIYSVPLAGVPDGGTPSTVLAKNQSPHPYAIDVDATNVYWTNGGNGLFGSVMTCAKTGCNLAPTMLVGAGQEGWHVDSPRGAAIDVKDGYFYWVSLNGGEVNRVPTDGGQWNTVSAATGTAPYCLGLSGSTLAQVNFNGPGSSILSTALSADAGSPSAFVGGQSYAMECASDGTSIFWTSWEPNHGTPDAGPALSECPIAGCNFTPHVLAMGIQPTWGVATDATWAYWISMDGKLYKVAK
jgi:hypothetical protein